MVANPGAPSFRTIMNVIFDETECKAVFYQFNYKPNAEDHRGDQNIASFWVEDIFRLTGNPDEHLHFPGQQDCKRQNCCGKSAKYVHYHSNWSLPAFLAISTVSVTPTKTQSSKTTLVINLIDPDEN